VELENVSYYYDKEKVILKDLSLAFEVSKYYGIYGANGTGKSTIAKLMTGLLFPKKGKVLFKGERIKKDNLSLIRKQIGIVFQNPDNQFVGATVEEDIAFGLENRQVSSQEMHRIVSEYAEIMQITDLLKKDPEALSGGQKQKCAICGILALTPAVLILDEATSMLDPSSKKEFKKSLGEIRKKYPLMSIISITHEIEDMSDFDEIILLDEGNIVFQGGIKDVLNNIDAFKKSGIHLPIVIELAKELNIQAINKTELIDQLCLLNLKK
jgi:energy-coupling factor transport system ATP-binding protein